MRRKDLTGMATRRKEGKEGRREKKGEVELHGDKEGGQGGRRLTGGRKENQQGARRMV